MTNKPVLYAEDEENDALFLQRAFKLAAVEHKLIVVPDGQEAINYCSGAVGYSNRDEYPLPCLLLLDLNMPRRSGLEVLKWVRSEPAISTLPVIVLTSSLHDADVHRAYLQGANAYLVKPTNPGHLVAIAKTIKDFWLTHNRMPTKSWNLVDAGGLQGGF
ncbi:MAG: response regulator [Verrucomicrobiota bacterium]|jgi:CheY-like chemotaxis protein